MRAHRAKTVSVIGAGGKTTLCRALLAALPGRRVFSTTTHIFLPPDVPCLTDPDAAALRTALSLHDALCVTGPLLLGSGKATPPSPDVFAQLFYAADYVLLEADGARGHLLKAHGAHEPAVPPETDLVVFVMGHAALGKPLSEAVHRIERVKDVFCKDPEMPVAEADFVSAALAARARVACGVPFFATLNAVFCPESGARIRARMLDAGIPTLLLPRCAPGADPVAFVAEEIGRSFLFTRKEKNQKKSGERESFLSCLAKDR